MQLVDRIEKRRFVGREFLLWLWFESEVLEGTLSTKEHGSFGLWIERHQAHRRAALASTLTGGDPSRAPWLMRRYGCAGCHAIAGLPGADGRVGPALSGLIDRVIADRTPASADT